MDRKARFPVSRNLIEKLNGEKDGFRFSGALRFENNLAINDKSSAEDIAKAIDTCVVYLWNVHRSRLLREEKRILTIT